MAIATAEQEPWRVEWPTADPLDDDVALQRKIEQSEFWKMFKHALSEVRERVFETTPETIEQLWRREGALGQLTYLLHHTPVLVVWQQRKDHEHA